MALSFAFSETRRDVWGTSRLWIGTINASGTYAAGGASVDTEDVFGMYVIDFILTERAAYKYHYNNGTSKMQLYSHTQGAAAQPTAAQAEEEVDNLTLTNSFAATPVIIIGR